MAHDIICADCGDRRTARNSNTRYCHRCRLLRNIEFFLLPHTHRDCADCGRTYAPIERGDPRCGRCTLGYSTMKGHCGMCEVDDVFLARPGVNICKVCVRDPAIRRRLVGIMQRAQARRKSAPTPA